MPDKVRKIMIAILGIVAVVALIVTYTYKNRLIYNPEGVHGNTAGNLNNNGMFCEYDGKIYFANPYDMNRLYSMNLDCSDIQKLNDDTVCSINVCGNNIYYVRNNYTKDLAAMLFRGQLLGVIRTDLKGKRPYSLYESVAGVINLYGNDLYYQHYSNKEGFSFYKVGIDGRNEQRISDAGTYPSSIYNDKLYYCNTTSDHAIYTYDLNTKQNLPYLYTNAYMVDMQGDYLYYIDLDDSYSLVRYNTHTEEKTILVDGHEGRCISYNIYGNSLFYHVEGETPALYRMNVDGSNNQFIKLGNVTNISCTSQYTFFQLFEINSLFRVPTTGGVEVDHIRIE